MIEPVVISGPTTEPVSLDEVQAHCNVDASIQSIDNLIVSVYVPAAREYVEWVTKSTVHEKTLELRLPCFPACRVIELPWATPLIAVESVKYTDSDGAETTWASSNYVVSAGDRKHPGRLAPAYGATWPSFTPYPLDAVKIRYRAGIETTSPVTDAGADVKYAVSLLVAGMYENRESEVVTDRAVIQAIAMSFGVNAFLERLKAKHEF